MFGEVPVPLAVSIKVPPLSEYWLYAPEDELCSPKTSELAEMMLFGSRLMGWKSLGMRLGSTPSPIALIDPVFAAPEPLMVR